MSEWRKKEPDFPPSKSEISKIFEGLHWHQRWEIFKGVFTPGRNPVEFICEKIQLPDDLRGLRILDVGSWHGCFAFECERRGAEQVIALSPETPESVGFDRLKGVLDSKVVKYVQGSVYDLAPAKLGKFDIVLFSGVLYHLRYPLLAIDHLRRVSKGVILIETHVIDHCFIPGNKTSKEAVPLNSINPELTNVPLWQFYQKAELGKDPSNWFGPNIKAVISTFTSAGFETELLTYWGTRAAFRGKACTSEYQQLHCYESLFNTIQNSVGLTDSVAGKE